MHHEASIGLTCAGIPRFQRCRAARALRKPSAYPCQQWCLLLDLKHVWPRTTAELHEWRKVARTAASSFSSSSWAGRQELSAVLKNNKRARTGAQAGGRTDRRNRWIPGGVTPPEALQRSRFSETNSRRALQRSGKGRPLSKASGVMEWVLKSACGRRESPRFCFSSFNRWVKMWV